MIVTLDHIGLHLSKQILTRAGAFMFQHTFVLLLSCALQFAVDYIDTLSEGLQLGLYELDQFKMVSQFDN